jgi:uncharacterized protein (DUF2062 family)
MDDFVRDEPMKRWLRRLIDVRDTPEALARGLSIGFFFGVSLFWGVQILLAVLFSQLLRGNKVVAAAMTAISNPFTNLPLYAFCYYVGRLVVGGQGAAPEFAQLQSLEAILAVGPAFLVDMLIGTTLVGAVGALVIYFAAQRLVSTVRGWLVHRVLPDNEPRTRSSPADQPISR